MAKRSLDNRTMENDIDGNKEIQDERNSLKDKSLGSSESSDRSQDTDNTLVKKNKSHGKADLGNALLLKNKSTKYKDSDNKDSDNKDSDNKDSNNKDSDNKDSDNKDSDNKDSDNKDSDNKDSDNKDSDNKDTESTKDIGDQICELNENNNNEKSPVIKPDTPRIQERRNTSQTHENSNGVSNEPIGNENSTNRTEEGRSIVSHFFMSTLVSSLILSFILTVVTIWILTALGLPPPGMLYTNYAAGMMSRAPRIGFFTKLVASLQSWVTGGIEMCISIILDVVLVSCLVAFVIPFIGVRRGGARGGTQERN